MKRLGGFFRHYKLLALTVLAIIAGLILQLLGQHTALHWVLGVVAILAVLPLLWDMISDVRAGSYGIDILAVTAIVTAVILHQYWAAIIVVLMLTGGEALEDYAGRRAQRELDDLLERAPQTATVLRKKNAVVVSVSQIAIRDKIIIKPGEVVPVDCTILEGSGDFDESSLTGESLPQSKTAGDTLLSGSINNDGSITAQATAVAADSQYQQIIRLVRNAVNSQAPFVRLAERYSLPFTFTAFAIASAVWIVSGHAIRFLEVIIVATPCPLLLAAPIALISGMARASRYGIIVKTGGALERLAEVRTIAFDKTGTLTRGELRVTNIATQKGFKQADVLGLAAALEQHSNHVIAKAVVTAALDKSIKIAKVKHVKEIAGKGVQASLKSQQVLVGRAAFLEENNVTIPALFKPGRSRQSSLYVAVDGEVAGVINLEDTVRDEAEETLRELQANGVRNISMVTGDNRATALSVAKQLGISNVYADALPADKIHAVEATGNRPVAFVGDGINDAPVLTAADVGIALGARGSAAASEAADIVIAQDDLLRVATAHGIARRTFSIARQSILGGIALSLILMLIFATGKLAPIVGALAQEVVDVVVIINALRARASHG